MLLTLLLFGTFGLLTSTVFAAMVAAGAWHHLRGRRDSEPVSQGVGCQASSFTPPVSLLKPLHGAEPGLAEHLATFFEQDYPEFELLFCACAERDAGLETARKLAQRYPQVKARFLWTDGQPAYINAKVASLETMTREAAHDLLIISDSDVRVTPDYLRAVAAPFADPTVGAVTCLYRGVAAQGGLWARLEAVGMSVAMTAGVLVANLLEGMQFALGPTMAVRRGCVERMGGMGSMGDYCSDDYILGNQVYLGGSRVVLSRHTIDHIVLNASFLDSLRHQARWMKSTRFSRPKGHFGTALTFSMPFALLAMGAALGMRRPLLGWGLLAVGVLTRWTIAWAAGRAVVNDRSLLDLVVLYPVRDLMGFGFWAASYVSSRILWRGRWYDLLAGGRMRAADEG